MLVDLCLEMKRAFVSVVLTWEESFRYLCHDVSDRGGLLPSFRFQRIKVPNVKCLKAAGLDIGLHKESVGMEYFFVK